MNNFPHQNPEKGFSTVDQRSTSGALHTDDQRAGLAHPDAENVPAADARGSHAHVLSERQKTTLRALIAQHHGVRAVQSALAQAEDMPPIGDYTIRYYRARIDNGSIRLGEKERTKAMYTGLARKETRIAQLSQMHEELAAIPLVSLIATNDASGEVIYVPHARLDVARERREVLKRISVELGQWRQPVAESRDPAEEAPTSAAVLQEAVHELHALLAAMRAVQQAAH